MVKIEPWNQINLKHFTSDHCLWTKVKPLSRFSCSIEKMRNQSRHFVTSFPPTRLPRIEMVCLRSNTRGWCPLRLHGDNDMSSLLITKEVNYIKRSRTEGWTCFICFCRHSSNFESLRGIRLLHARPFPTFTQKKENNIWIVPSRYTCDISLTLATFLKW